MQTISFLSILNVVIVILAAALVVMLTSVFISTSTIFNIFSMVLIFLIASVLLFISDVEFFSIVLTTVYVGAISVFFIFVLMTINLRFEDSFEYVDEIKKDKWASFIFLFFFSCCAQFIFLVEFNPFYKIIYLIDSFSLRSGGSQLGSLEKSYFGGFVYDDIGGGGLPIVVSSPLEYAAFTSFDSAQRFYSFMEIDKISFSLFHELSLAFIVVTYILLFSMVASLNFAIKSRVNFV